MRQIQGSSCAFAALRADGTVVAWGSEEAGGDTTAVEDQLQNVQTIGATAMAFAAILSDGSVISWGDARNGGDNLDLWARGAFFQM